MAWINEANLPWALSGTLFFSPVFGQEIYLLDQGNNFYKYNFVTGVYTALNTIPDFQGFSCYRTLVPNSMSNPTELWCVTEKDAVLDDGGLRLSRYNIATNVWTNSSQTPYMYGYQLSLGGVVGVFQVDEVVTGGTSGATGYVYNLNVDGDTNVVVHYQNGIAFQVGEVITGGTSLATGTITAIGPRVGYIDRGMIKSLVYVSNNDIRCWVWRFNGQWGRCIRYDPTTDRWMTASSNFHTQILTPICAAINPAETIVYGGSAVTILTYNIATDAYSTSVITAGRVFANAHTHDRLPYRRSATMQQGYLDTVDGSEHDDIFEENTDRDPNYGGYFGITNGWHFIIARARAAAPELMSTGFIIPSVQTNPATAITHATATLNGTLDDDGGEACACGFQWGDTIAYGHVTPTDSKVSGETFWQPLVGLDPNKTYHYRAFATNSAGTAYGADMTFTTLGIALPTVTTAAVTGLGIQVATLNGTLTDDGGEACACGFEWGKAIPYTTTTPTESKITGQSFSQIIAPLEPATVYHFRAFATNSAGTAYGADIEIRTYPALSRAFSLSKEEL